MEIADTMGRISEVSGGIPSEIIVMPYPFDAIQELLSDQAHSQYSFHLPLILAIDRDGRLGVYCKLAI